MVYILKQKTNVCTLPLYNVEHCVIDEADMQQNGSRVNSCRV